MIDRTDLDLRCAAHAGNVARVNHEGWRRLGTAPTRGVVRREDSVIAVATRLRVGETMVWIGGKVVRMGERLHRMFVNHAFDAVPHSSGPAAGRDATSLP